MCVSLRVLEVKRPGPDTDCRRTPFRRQWNLENSVSTLALLFLDRPPHRNPVGTGHGWELPELEDLKFASRAESSLFHTHAPEAGELLSPQGGLMECSQVMNGYLPTVLGS